MPNTASTPSALRHSMMASTALTGTTSFLRIRRRKCAATGRANALYQRVFGLTRACPSREGSRQVHLFGHVLVGAAAPADLVGDRQHRAALLAVAAQLVTLVAVEDRRERPEYRQARAHQEPDEERAALDLPDGPGRQAEEEH